MKRRCAIYLFALLVMTLCGCAEKKPLKRAHLPVKYGTRIRFEGIKDGKCEIADVLLDVKTGGYVVVCK